jgi:hypothetical protein
LRVTQTFQNGFRRAIGVVSLVATPLGFLTLSNCKSYIDASGSTSASLTASSIGTGGGTSVTFTPASGTLYSTVTVNEGSGFITPNICNGQTIFGLAGTASCAQSGSTAVVSITSLLDSGASRNSTTSQITYAQETGTYAGADLPSGYRDIPVVAIDDDGGDTTSVVTRLTRGTTLANNYSLWNTGVPRVMCGIGIATVAGRIADCDTKHGVKPSWDYTAGDGKISWNGATSGFGLGAEGSWTLVTVYSAGGTNGTTCNAANALTTSCREVWRDDRTGLLWSDRIGDNASSTTNVGQFSWCVAAGNTENGLTDCRSQAGGGVSGTSYNYIGFSLCAEAAGVTTPIGITSIAGEQVAKGAAWTQGVSTGVRDAKGGMMKAANADTSGGALSPSVRWRVPSKWDYAQAEIDGIRLVLPNFYTQNEAKWAATVFSSGRAQSWYQDSANGNMNTLPQSSIEAVHCVGR